MSCLQKGYSEHMQNKAPPVVSFIIYDGQTLKPSVVTLISGVSYSEPSAKVRSQTGPHPITNYLCITYSHL